MQADRATRALLTMILVCLLVLVAQSLRAGAGPDEALLTGLPTTPRFALTTVAAAGGSPLLLRLDSATGQVWKMRLLAEGRWDSYAEGPDGVPSAGASKGGRYVVRPIGQRRGPPTLVRTDTATGRIWRVGLISEGSWVLVPGPSDEAADAEADPDAGAGATL